jgi:hypothetical protein
VTRTQSSQDRIELFLPAASLSSLLGQVIIRQAAVQLVEMMSFNQGKLISEFWSSEAGSGSQMKQLHDRVYLMRVCCSDLTSQRPFLLLLNEFWLL